MKKLVLLSLVCVCYIDIYASEISFINSDSSEYTNKEVSCMGNVLVTYYDYAISADILKYNRENDTVFAQGNVIIKHHDGTVYFADEILVHKDFSNGYAKNIKIISEDKTRLAAKFATIKNDTMTLKNVIYSPCYQCLIDNDITWQIKSRQVIFKKKESVEYQDANFEILGESVLWIPFFTHRSPSSESNSGFLPPKFETSSNNGISVALPYLIDISKSKELILRPLLTTKAGAVAEIYYGWRLPHGKFDIDASITGTKTLKDAKEDSHEIQKIRSHNYRGHLFSSLNYDINDVWRGGFNIKWVSDKFYLKRFDLLNKMDRTLESNLFFEGFDNDNYTLIKLAKFQSDDSDAIPSVLPILERNYSSNLFGGMLFIDANVMNLDFNESRNAQKVVLKATWEKNFLLIGGHLLTLDGILLLKTLRVSEKRRSEYNSATAAIPQVRILWQWPLVCNVPVDAMWKTIITPIAGLIASSNKEYMDIFEYPFSGIDTLNLFSGNRSISLYELDSRSRVCYGMKIAAYNNSRNVVQFIIGRSVELNKAKKYFESSGLKYKCSNWVTGLDIFINDNVSWISRGSYCSSTRRWTQIESGIRAIYKKIELDTMLFNGKQCLFDPFKTNLINEDECTKKYKGVDLNLGYHINRMCKINYGIVLGNSNYEQDNEQKRRHRSKLIRHKIGFTFYNECTELVCEIARNMYHAGDLKPSTSLRLAVHLKNLGI